MWCEFSSFTAFQVENKVLSLFTRTGPDEHVEAVDKLQKSVKVLQKVRAFPLLMPIAGPFCVGEL